MAFNDPGGDGVAGWLAFFTVALGLFTPIGAMISLYGLYSDPSIAAAYGETWGRLQIFEWTVTAAALGGCWYIVWRLFKVQTWTTVRVTIAGIWLISIGSTLIEALGVWLISGFALAVVISGAGADLVRPIVFSAIWTTYFLVSKRVANTYPRHGDADEVAEVFN